MRYLVSGSTLWRRLRRVPCCVSLSVREGLSSPHLHHRLGVGICQEKVKTFVCQRIRVVSPYVLVEKPAFWPEHILFTVWPLTRKSASLSCQVEPSRLSVEGSGRALGRSAGRESRRVVSRGGS